jgi:hypothetical protein
MTTPNPPTPDQPTPDQPTPDPNRPEDADQAALFDAVAVEHGAIYGYGVVSAHVLPEENDLVSRALMEHRDRREKAVTMLTERSIPVPLPAPGYQLPIPVKNWRDAAKLAIRMEDDCAVAWRAVMEQSDSEQDRAFGLTGLTQCAVTAARWRQVLGAWPVIQAFPGGSE